MIQETHLKQCDVARFQNKHYRLIASSCALNKTKGVCILLNRKISCNVNITGNDENGRLAFARVCIFNHKLSFTSICCPNEPDKDFFSYIGNILLEQNDFSLVVGGDFNAVLNPSLDKSNSDAIGNSSSTLLKSLLKDLNLVDIWRIQNTTARDYTFFSNRHKTFSRIDYIFLSPTLAGHTSINILPILLSDHSALLCNIDLPNIKTKAPRWRLNTSLLTNSGFLSSLKVQLKDFLDTNTKDCSNPQILWEATKCFIRGFCIHSPQL